MKKLQLIFLFLLLTIILTANQNKGTLTGKWMLLCFTDFSQDTQSCRPSRCSPEQLTFTFMDDGRKGSIEGFTTVNKVSGDYVIDGHQIEVKSFGGTKIAEQGWGNDIWRIIYNSSSFYFQQDTLVIRYDKDTKGMIFVPVEKNKDIK